VLQIIEGFDAFSFIFVSEVDAALQTSTSKLEWSDLI
jgi:hypothetical protein